uniref:DnaJ homolog subfamily C member 30, mitochondrial n=1 Tax=Echeneis naucrates TaxID=173247 RepID=A0A665VAE4_ECHNA
RLGTIVMSYFTIKVLMRLRVTGYYELLEVLPSATQAQIKTAYYKQSFAYHPDRNAGSGEATVRFSEISEAYSVLGNKALRKKYDRGLLSLSDLTATVRPSSRDGGGASAKQPTGGRRSPLSSDIRGGRFDFDTFFKSHYSEQLQRQRDTRVRQEELRKKKEEPMVEKRLGVTMEMCGGLVLVMAIILIISLKRIQHRFILS